MIHIILVDDHQIVREGIAKVLNRYHELNVVSSVGSLKELFIYLEHDQPDLILMDIKLEDGDGVSASMQVKKLYPKIKIILLSGYIKPHLADQAKRFGIEGYLLKSIATEALKETIVRVTKGAYVYDPEVAEENFIESTCEHLYMLSPKENQLLCLMSLGKTNNDIAEAMFVTEKTVRNYCNRLYKKLNVKNRTEAVSTYMRYQLIK